MKRLYRRIVAWFNHFEIQCKYLLSGMLFGALFPIVALIFEFYRSGMTAVTLINITQMIKLNPLILMISSAPFFLGIFALLAGIKQAKVITINQSLQAEIVERKKIQKNITQIAYHDHLTGLPNRRLFMDRLNQAIDLTRRLGKPLGVIFVDLDDFKLVNDTMGHDQGDLLLKEVADRLKEVVRRDDTVARFGGDEFILLVQNLHEPGDVETIVKKVIGCFKQTLCINGQEFNITCSVGVSLYPLDGDNGEALIKNADIAMYKAKEKGKNQYMLCTSFMKAEVAEIMSLTNYLYRALERNELVLYYQPQVMGKSGQIIGLEALVRWNHPELGLISPSKFIPIAEYTGLIIPIGEWVLRQACKQIKIWQNAGCNDLRIAVNLSIGQLKNKHIVDTVRSVLMENDLDPKFLELEITESIAMMDDHDVFEILKNLKSLGISLSIDDFGTEYSSLSHLKNMPVDRIKIAMPFIQGIDINEKDEAITKAIIILANNLGMNIIAEGVETKQQLDFLNNRMCDEIQGFYFYKPMPAHAIEAVLFEGMTTTATINS